MSFVLPELSYDKTSLEPHIDVRTMEIHHGKHHQAYVTNLNNAVKGTEFENLDILDLLGRLKDLPDSIRGAVRNNGGGHANHSLFWSVISPNGGGVPSGELASAINESFGSLDAFKEAFGTAAKTRFGSGWAWLGMKNGKLVVCSTPNQDNPLMQGLCDCSCTPILGLDVWEHAYYLNYQNRRPDYVSAFWNIVNWEQVSKNFSNAK
ncbi:superoxide dismutase [bacterium]|jgi:superoxide dismutase, Fe-Mn family|nr:superoxide dismutase [bacterium]